MGEVYLAHHEALGVVRALKVLRATVAPEIRPLERLRREARTLAAVNHPNVVTVHDLESANGELALVMEFVAGETLQTHVLRSGSLPPSVVAPLLDGIAAGLDAIHAAGILHRDLKPSNVLLAPAANRELIPRIVDFGIARPISDAEQLTAPQFVLGTPAYMSPEQAAALPLDQRADVFSLTCVVAFMLSGCTPSTPRGSSPDLSSWPYASTWSESICSVLRAGFQRFHEDRPSSGGELARLFRDALAVDEATESREISPRRSHREQVVAPITEVIAREPQVQGWTRWATWYLVAGAGVFVGFLLSLLY